MYVDPFASVGKEIACSGCYEPETVALFRTLVAPGMVVVDAGAQMGQYTVLARDAVGPTGQVHAFEPDPTTFRYVKANADGVPNTICNCFALGRESGTVTVFPSTSGSD